MRVIAAAAEAGKQIAFLDFQLIDRAALLDGERFYRQFCVAISDALGLPDQTGEYWASPLGNSQRCTNYMGRYLLPQAGTPLLLAMDEVESVFDTSYRSDFFAMLRSWHNNRAYPHMPIWKKLDLALVTSTEPYQLIENLNQSPFNVGLVLDLEDFDAAQVADLNQRHGSPLNPAETHQLVELLGGHPYLTRRALYLLASGQWRTPDFFGQAASERGPFGDHLRYHLFRLHGRAELVRGLVSILRTGTCDDDAIFFRLRGAGLVHGERRKAGPRCRLYASYFAEHLQ